MIFLWSNSAQFEEEDEEEGEGALNDALLDALDSDVVDDDVLEGEIPPPVVVPELEEEEGEDATARAFFEDEDVPGEDEADLDYDSFDDKDDL
jgi:hypothetical protein